MSRTLALARKELRDVGRERSLVVAILVQLLVAAFSTFLTVGLVGLYDPDAAPGRVQSVIAYSGPGGFDEYLRNATNLRVVTLPIQEAVESFHTGRVAAVVEELYPEPGATRTVALLVPDAELRTSILVAQLKELLFTYERDLRFEREARIDQPVIYVQTDAEANPYYAFAYGVLLPLLILTPVFLAGATAGDAFTHELETRNLLLLRASPLRVRELLVGKLLVPTLLVPAQVLLWILLLRLNGLPVAHVGLVLLVAFLLGAILATGGALIALTVRREGPTQAAYTLVVLTLGVASLYLPRDPFNLLARLGAGAPDAARLPTLTLYAATLAVLFALATWAARRAMRSDPD